MAAPGLDGSKTAPTSDAVRIAELEDALSVLAHAVGEFMLNAQYVVVGSYEDELVEARDDAVTLLTGEVPDAQ